jgi:NAD(P)-dependent dehydrogenase (short-subunit alcohol dehydrogenase family)
VSVSGHWAGSPKRERACRAAATPGSIRCDHTVDADVAALAERIRRDGRRVDILVNNAWGGYEQREEEVSFFDAPFWKQPMWRWDAMFTAGVRASYLTSRHLARERGIGRASSARC